MRLCRDENESSFISCPLPYTNKGVGEAEQSMGMGMLGVAVRLRRCLKPQNTTILSSYSYHSSSSNRQRKNENQVDSSFNRDPTSPPRLFVVQPRLRPDTLLQAKLNEALCLANSLEEQRDGYFDSDFFDKPLPPHILVQNPIFRSSKARAGFFSFPNLINSFAFLWFNNLIQFGMGRYLLWDWDCRRYLVPYQSNWVKGKNFIFP